MSLVLPKHLKSKPTINPYEVSLNQFIEHIKQLIGLFEGSLLQENKRLTGNLLLSQEGSNVLTAGMRSLISLVISWICNFLVMVIKADDKAIEDWKIKMMFDISKQFDERIQSLKNEKENLSKL